MYLFRGDAPVKEFAGAFKPPMRWGVRMIGKKFLREYPYREAYLLRDARQFRAELTMPLILLGGITNRETMDLAMAEGFDSSRWAGRCWPSRTCSTGSRPTATRTPCSRSCTHCNKCMPTIYSHTHCVSPVRRTGSPNGQERRRPAAPPASVPLELDAMSRPAAPALTVRYDGSPRTFAAGHDVVVGRDLRADVRIAHPLISRAHVVLRFDHGRWVAIDNGSLNGMFVNGQRRPRRRHQRRHWRSTSATRTARG